MRKVEQAMLSDLDSHDCWLLDRWSFDQVGSVLRALEIDMDECFRVCMTTHYSSGRYINAKARWDQRLAAHDSIRKWAYSSVPHWIYEQWFGEDR